MLLLLLRHPNSSTPSPRTGWPARAVERRCDTGARSRIVFRIAKTDVTIAGVTISAGSMVQLCFASGTATTQSFELTRRLRHPARQPAQAARVRKGPHSCLGAGLARSRRSCAFADSWPGFRPPPGPRTRRTSRICREPIIDGVLVLPAVWNTRERSSCSSVG